MRFDAIAKLRHMLQVMAFCLAIATVQYGFAPERPYAPLVAYSLAIGLITWAIIDLGRHYFPSAQETGWPHGVPGLLLVVGGMAAGYLLGTTLADTLCRSFGWYAGQPRIDRATELRTSILITALAGIACVFYFYSINKSQYLERKMAETRRHADEARLKLLETQLEPHMLFNTLANLRVLIGADPARAQQMLDHMIAYLRATLGGSRATTHPLQSEFERLRDYLALMAIRMGPRLQYAIDLPQGLAQQPVPTLLLQPLVENCIQHGLEPKLEGGRIDVSAREQDGRLVLRVADTGAGCAEDRSPWIPASPGTTAASAVSATASVISAKAGTQGFGMAQVRERLASQYGDAAQLRFDSRPGEGAVAEIHLPLQS